ncbi:MAG: hypothetical protein KC417_14115, partial [Myxococcales bacterium]|nr:hypothetical protein [Myxococcales bacterium]
MRFDSDTKTATIVGERKLRGLWDHLTGLETDDETLGRARIAERITWLKQHKVNAVFIWTVSRYLNAVRSGKSDEQMPWATWDP